MVFKQLHKKRKIEFFFLTNKSSLMKYPKKLTWIAILLLGLGGLHAQETIPATGGDATGGGGSSSYTVAQVAYIVNTGMNASVAQGVQQPYEISTIVGVEEKDINLELVVYPNPTSNVLTLKVDNYNNGNLTYQLCDIQGKLIERKQVVSPSTIINMRDLSVNIYLLSVLDNNLILKTFKVLKN